MRRSGLTLTRGVLIVALALLVPVIPLLAQGTGDDDAVWASFLAWVTAASEQAKLADYGAQLASDGLAPDEVERRLGLIRRLASENPERGIELTYDRIYSKRVPGPTLWHFPRQSEGLKPRNPGLPGPESPLAPSSP